MKHDIIFEALPCGKNSSEAYVRKCVERLCENLNGMKDVTMLNIPEIVEENHSGLPYYRNYDNRKFGLMLGKNCGKDLMINTVASYKTKNEFTHWLDECIEKYGIKNFVFVGANI